jgi:dihydroflavonol-4-reductase
MMAGKTLVTGATAFTRSHLCRRLLAEGEQVVAFTRTSSGELAKMGVECRTVDVRNRPDVVDNFAGITRVFHIAAAYRTEHADTREFNAVNVEGTRNVGGAGRTLCALLNRGRAR